MLGRHGYGSVLCIEYGRPAQTYADEQLVWLRLARSSGDDELLGLGNVDEAADHVDGVVGVVGRAHLDRGIL